MDDGVAVEGVRGGCRNETTQLLARIGGPGGVPAHFKPALEHPQILENLAHQTVAAYLDNPLPGLFKERLLAYLSRFCSAPYWVAVHSANLRAHGMAAKEIVDLLERPLDEIERLLPESLGRLSAPAEPPAFADEDVFRAAVVMFRRGGGASDARAALRRALGAERFGHLTALLSYFRTCRDWVEAHPELSPSDEERLTALRAEEPRFGRLLAGFRDWPRRERDERERRRNLEMEGIRRSEEELRRTREELERRVQERTARLSALIEELQGEIAQRKAAQSASTLLALIVTGSDDAIVGTNLQDIVISWNPAAERIYGYSAEEILGQSIARLLPAGRGGEQADLALRIAAGERIKHFETVRRTRHGDSIQVSLTVSPIRDGDGLLTGLSWVTRDVTLEKRAERRLAAQHAVTEILSNAASLGDATPHVLKAIGECLGWDVGALWKSDASSGELVCVDVWHAAELVVPEFEAVTRRTRFARGRELPGRVWLSGRPAWIPDVAEDDDFPRAPVAALANLHGAFALPIRVGGDVPGVIEFFSREIREPDEDLLRMMEAVGAQIGQFLERRRAEEELRSSESRFRAVAETACDAIVSTGRDGRIRYCNKAAQSLFGYASGEMFGLSLMTLMAEEQRDRHAQGIERHAETGHSSVVGRATEMTGRRKDGTEFPMELSLACWMVGDDPQFTAIMRDVRERKRAEEERAKLHAQLFQGQKLQAVGQLAAGMAHEINNPCGYILSNLSTMLEYHSEVERVMEEALERLKRKDRPAWRRLAGPGNGDSIDVVLKDFRAALEESLTGTLRIRDIVMNLREFVQGDEGERKATDLNAGLESAIRMCWNEIKYKATVHRDLGSLPLVVCYPRRIHQVFVNLLVNAAQAIREKGEIHVSTRQEGAWAVVRIVDTGAGIAPEHLKRIFEPFFTTKPVGLGTGLGLHVAYKIVQSHGGSISVASVEGEGTEFSIRLPLEARKESARE